MDAAECIGLPVENQFAAVGGLQKIHASQQGGLAAAAGTQNGHHIPLLHFKVDALQNFQSAERFLNIPYREHLIPPFFCGR